VGWLNLLGQTAGVASTEFGLAQMICMSTLPCWIRRMLWTLIASSCSSRGWMRFGQRWRLCSHYRHAVRSFRWSFDRPWILEVGFLDFSLSQKDCVDRGYLKQLPQNSGSCVLDARVRVRQHRNDIDHFYRLVGNHWPRKYAPCFLRVWPSL
jgi:hypothetical protein